MSDGTGTAGVSGVGRRGLSDAERAIGLTVAALLDASMDRPPVAPRAWFAGHLGVSETDCGSLAETFAGFVATDVLLALGQLLLRCPPDALAAADRDDADVTWMRMPGGDERLPTGFRAVWQTLSRSETPFGVMVRVAGEQECTLWVYAREEAVERARRELDDLLRDLVADIKPPFQGQVVTVDFSRAGERLTPVALPELSRADLILPQVVWDAVDRDVHGMLDKTPMLERLGLGLDRGVLFHGGPGTARPNSCAPSLTKSKVTQPC